MLIRWIVALAGSVGIIGLIYHMGTPMQQSWKRILPGAIVATVMWFLATLAFGWYVTRFANYSQVYGSLGAGIALLFWLYIISLCVLCGAEFNAEFHARFFHPHHTQSAPAAPKHPSTQLELPRQLKLTGHTIRNRDGEKVPAKATHEDFFESNSEYCPLCCNGTHPSRQDRRHARPCLQHS